MRKNLLLELIMAEKNPLLVPLWIAYEDEEKIRGALAIYLQRIRFVSDFLDKRESSPPIDNNIIELKEVRSATFLAT